MSCSQAAAVKVLAGDAGRGRQARCALSHGLNVLPTPGERGGQLLLRQPSRYIDGRHYRISLVGSHGKAVSHTASKLRR
jgi:hypothetical protein